MESKATTAHRRCTLAVSLAWLLLAMASPALAQDFDRYRPRTPDNTEEEYEAPEEPKEAKGNKRVVLGELRALIFVDHPKKVVQGNLDAHGIQFDGHFVLAGTPGFQRVVGPYLGGPVSLFRLNEMVRDIILFYREMGQPVVDVSIPAQRITSGVVQVVVNEGRIGKVCVEDTCYFDARVLYRQIWLCSGQPIYESQLKKELQWLNRNPFRTVGLELTPGKKFGTTDVMFKVKDRFPWRLYAGYEDTGTLPTDLERAIIGVNWGNAFGLDHQFGYQFAASTNWQSLWTHSVVYSIPMYNRNKLFFYGSYGEFNPDLGNVNPLLEQSGRAWQLSGRYHHELCPRCRYKHRWAFGFDFKRLNSDLDFGGLNVFDEAADVAQFVVGYHGGWHEGCAWFHWGADVFIGPGDLSSGNHDDRFQQFRNHATSDYYYARAYARRAFCLAPHGRLVTRVTGQLAEGNLLPSEQLGFGGYHTVRGYDMRLLNGDSGYIVNVELQSRPICLGLGPYILPKCSRPCGSPCCGALGPEKAEDAKDDDRPAIKQAPDELRFLVFYDFGQAWNHTLLPDEDPSVELESAGVGFRYKMGPSVWLRVDYGWQLRRLQFLEDRDGRCHVGGVVSY